MAISEALLEVREYTGEGYRPLVDFDAWRVALLNWCEELAPEHIKSVQRHMETDEVFVLLRGRCILFVCDGEETVGAVHGEDLAPGKLYNVKKAVWHTHTLSRDAMVLIVENHDTTAANSPSVALTPGGQAQVAEWVKKLWKRG